MQAALLDVLRGQLPSQCEIRPEVGALLDDMVRTATHAWPEVRLEPETFVGRVAYHFSGDETLEGWLKRVHAADLYLATACAERVPGAVGVFDREFLRSVPAMLARGGIRDVQPDEVTQQVREKLFVGACKIAEYSGRGALASWLNVVTLRIALDALRSRQASPVDSSAPIDESKLVGPDLELELIKERYREPFKRALRSAISALSSEQRNLLKLHFVDGVTLDKLASLFNVHRATIARRIANARDTAFDSVRQQLHAELGIDREEFEGLVSLLRSRLELSLSALLPSVS